MSHVLQIDRIVSEWRIPRDQPPNTIAPEQLDDLVMRQFPGALASLLEPLLQESDESIWLIRKLGVSFGADLAWDADRLGQRLAVSVVKTLIEILQKDPDNHSVFRYRSRAEYLAAFMTDLSSGDPWCKWQYESFSGLSALSPSAALRTLLLSEPAVAVSALAMLTRSLLRRVVATLLSSDAALVWNRMMDETGHASSVDLLAVLELWESDRGVLPHSVCLERESLLLLVRTLQTRSAESNRRDVVAAVSAVMALEGLRDATPAENWAEVQSMVLCGQIDHLVSIVGNSKRAALACWTAHPAALERAITAMAGAARTESQAAEVRTTMFGAVFLLLPLIEQLPAERWSKQATLLKFALFVQCCTADVRDAARNDAFLHELFGISSGPDLEQLELRVDTEDVWTWMRQEEGPGADMEFDAAYLGTLDPVSTAAHQVLRAFAWKLPGFGTCSLPHLWSNFLDFHARIQLSPDSIVVKMAAPALHVILRLAGLSTGSYTLPRIDPRPFHLFQEG